MSEPCYDLAIVGGGPAGQAAAEQAVAAGLTVVMLDEQARMGGQILRQPPLGMTVPRWLDGRGYRALKRQLARAEALPGLTWSGRTSVAGVLREAAGFALIAVPTDGAPGRRIAARRLLVAAGCYDLPLPLPGWTLPGVMSAGAIQAFVKSQRLVPGERFVLAGTHPLQLILADQIVAAGGQVAALLFAQASAAAAGALAHHAGSALRHAGPLAAAAASYVRLRRAGVPIRFGRTVLAVEGSDEVVAARVGVPGEAGEVIACDRVGLCFGFLPQADLPRSLGATARWVERTGGWATVADAWQRGDVPGLYVAGETTGVAGAPAALEEGRIAGIAVARDAGRIDAVAAERAAAEPRRRLARLRGFAALLDAVADPRAVVTRLASDDTIVCRCEDVTRAQLLAAAGGVAAPSDASALKLVTRAGMGLCQGRGCEAAVLRLLAERTGVAPAAIGGFTPRFPVRPVPIASVGGADCH
ncbi:FAD-dependent oxidoreductase [Sphingomonas yunnanensis]|uniref:FAD/NAD(P)-dependent oxidoreductase n=1 Tax=Sphingomonas yunnanensis TaxID=310400 RepID=UPI001CA71548|nr:FAD-dependent oxidoreductase [Sphingomonas yunnanensis]